MLQLITPDLTYMTALMEAASEMYPIGDWDATSAALDERFDTILHILTPSGDPAIAPPGTLPSINYWLLEDGVGIGLLTLRPHINDELMQSEGHIGYMIRPSRRNQEYGTAILKLGLERARAIGLTRVLLTCADTNIGSRKVIEANGGQLENILQVDADKPPVRRYWITLNSDGTSYG